MTYTLLGDGSSDRALQYVLDWILTQSAAISPVRGQWADLSRVPRKPTSLQERISVALDLYPCDIMFVHRDAEGAEYDVRRQEIDSALSHTSFSVRFVPVVPVRMMEAWLLCNEDAIRGAAGNPQGSQELDLPEVRNLERIPNPKAMLHSALMRASGLNNRRLSTFRAHERVHRVGELIQDFSPLLQLPAFQRLVDDIQVCCTLI